MPNKGDLQFLKSEDVISKIDLVEGMNVADLGCGNLGYFIIPIAKLIGKEGTAYAVDILKAALEGVRSKAKLEGLTNVETVWANLEKPGATPIPANSLDLALLVNVLFQNKDKLAILKESVRLLKKGGKLVIIDWKKTGTPFGPEVNLRVGANEIKELAKKLELILQEETEFGNYFWGLIYKKN